MHPRWACGDALPAFVEPLRRVGLQALEFELWDHDPDWPRFVPLMEDCLRLGFELCFHAPYRRPYNAAGFSGEERAEVEAAYAPLLDVAARFAPASVVVHGAHSETRSREALLSDTVAFLEWVLDRYPSLDLALENLTPRPPRVKIGTTRAGLLDIIRLVGDRRLGLCWDLGHDVRAGRLASPERAWLRHVVHVHLHDVDEGGKDHYPLLFERVPYRAWLPRLVQAGFAGIVTLEIKGERLAGLGMPRVMESLVASVVETARLLAEPVLAPSRE
jgi:sugar phosphate isomerase/epimerase